MAAPIVLVAAPPALASRVEAAAAGPVEQLSSAEQLPDLLERARELAAIALGRDVARPVELAQRVGRADSQLAVVILRAADEVADVAGALQFAPFIGEDVTCRSAEYEEVAASAVLAAAKRTLLRREHRATLRVAATRVGTGSGFITASARSQSLGTLLDQAPVGVLTVDAEGRIVSGNRYVERLLETRPAELAERPLMELFPDQARNRLQVLLLPGTPLLPSPTRRFSRRRSDGSLQELDITAARIESTVGQAGTILLLQEVTERAQTEREANRQALAIQEEVVRRLAEARAAIGAADQDRVAQLLDEALQCAQRLARELLAAGRSLPSAAHTA